MADTWFIVSNMSNKPNQIADSSVPTPTPVRIVCIIDRSGSMDTIRESAIAGFNEFLRSQKAIDLPATLTLVLFDDQYEVPFDRTPLANVPELDTRTFVPRGQTALLDAIGKTITASWLDAPGPVIVSILTDGQENASHEYTNLHINQLIADRRLRSWDFIFLAANQDAIASATKLGMTADSAFQFVANESGMLNAMACMSARVSTKRRKS